MKVKVDGRICQSLGLCTGIAPDIFELGDDGIALVKIDDVDGETLERARQAEEICPSAAITVEPD